MLPETRGNKNHLARPDMNLLVIYMHLALSFQEEVYLRRCFQPVGKRSLPWF